MILQLGFTSHLPNALELVSAATYVQGSRANGESGAHGMCDLDVLLIYPATRFTDLE